MPKNRSGCYFCGEKTARQMQVWLRTHSEKSTGTTSDSVVRSLCLPCADNETLDARELMQRQLPFGHGCAVCGHKCALRVQVWLRTIDPKKTTQSFTRTYCATHGTEIYERIGGRLGKDEPRTHGGGPKAGGLAKARKKIKRNAE